jgi:DNA-binding transcriptional LysR family regulator
VRFTNLDMDALRSFVAGIDAGSFAQAADRLGRSTSAISAQLKKLEDQTGTALVRRSGRGLALTDGGEALLSYARRILTLNDEAVNAVQSPELEGWIRLGIQEDFGETLLPHVLGRFARAHPKVRIEGRIGRNVELKEKIASGHLDLALAWNDGTAPDAETIASLPLCWLGPAEENPLWQVDGGEPLPLAVLEAPCLLRTLACTHLDRAGIDWRIAFVHPLAALPACRFWMPANITCPACLRSTSACSVRASLIIRSAHILRQSLGRHCRISCQRHGCWKRKVREARHGTL